MNKIMWDDKVIQHIEFGDKGAYSSGVTVITFTKAVSVEEAGNIIERLERWYHLKREEDNRSEAEKAHE